MNDKREWVIKTTYQDGTFDYGNRLSRKSADEWIRVLNRAWPTFSHEVVHVSLIESETVEEHND